MWGYLLGKSYHQNKCIMAPVLHDKNLRKGDVTEFQQKGKGLCLDLFLEFWEVTTKQAFPN